VRAHGSHYWRLGSPASCGPRWAKATS
jgi:hypothetical protein